MDSHCDLGGDPLIDAGIWLGCRLCAVWGISTPLMAPAKAGILHRAESTDVASDAHQSDLMPEQKGSPAPGSAHQACLQEQNGDAAIRGESTRIQGRKTYSRHQGHKWFAALSVSD